TDNTSGDFENNGAIRVRDDLGSVLVKGDLKGNSTNQVIISAHGQAKPSTTADVAIGKLIVLGNVDHALILAGVTPGGLPQTADAQVGAVFVGQNWIASSLAAGAVPGIDGFFGNASDAKMAGGGIKDVPGIVSKVAGVTVVGFVLGTWGGMDAFGIVAENVV